MKAAKRESDFPRGTIRHPILDGDESPAEAEGKLELANLLFEQATGGLDPEDAEIKALCERLITAISKSHR